MDIWESTVLTDKGAALQAKLIDGQSLSITKAMTGAAKVPIVNLRQQTSVTDGGTMITLQPVRVEGNRMVVPLLLENMALEESYDLWQVGIYAQDPEEGEILYCLAQASEAKHIPSVSDSPGFSVTWDFYFKTSNTSPFEVDLDSNGLVSIEQYQIHTGEINNLKGSVVKFDERIEVLILKLLDRIKIVTGTLPSSTGGMNLNYPEGYNNSNCAVLDIAIKYAGGNWRSGVGAHKSNDPYRLFASLDFNKIYVHCESNSSYVVGQEVRIVLIKI